MGTKLHALKTVLTTVKAAIMARIAAQIAANAEREPGEQGGRLFIQVMAIGAVAFLIWSAMAQIEVVSFATGEVIPASQVKSIQHLEGGIVSEILIKEGQQVAIDQPLVVLQAISSEADVGELALHIAGIQADIARLEAEAENRTNIIFPADVKANHPALVSGAKAMLENRRERYQSALTGQKEAMAQREHSATEISARLRNSRETLRLLTEQIGISEELLKDQLTNRMNHLALLREQSALKSRVDEDTAGLRRTESALKEAQSGLAGIHHAYQEDVGNQLSKARRDLEELNERLKKFSDSLSRTVLRSPVSGVVKTVYVTTRGGVVQAGKTVLDIVPADDRLVVEAKLPIYDVGYVRTGQHALVRLASSDGNRFGNIAGVVTNISPDSIVTEKGAYYKVRIETDTDRFRHETTEYRLLPGIQVVCNIITGHRSVLEYMTDPLRGYASRALHER